MPSPFTGPMWPGDPLMQIMMAGVAGDPALQDQAAHLLATRYQPPPIPPHADPQGTIITPPTVPQQTPQMRTPGDAGAGSRTGSLSGEPDRTPPSTVGNTGSDGQSIQPGPQAPIPMLRPDPPPPASASPRDDSSAHIPGEAAGLSSGQGGAFGAGTADPTGTSNTGDQASDNLKAFSKALAGLQAPKVQDERQGLAPLPQHETRFSPVDLMTLISALAKPGGGTAPQSLGALIGGR